MLGVPPSLPKPVQELLELGAWYQRQEKLEQALYCYELAQKQAQVMGHLDGQARVWVALALFHDARNAPEESINAYECAIPFLQQVGDVVELGKTGYRLSRMSFIARKIQQSNDWAKFALRYEKFMFEYEPRRLFSTYFFLGQNFQILYQLDSSLFYYERAVTIGEKRYALELSNVIFLIADIHYQQGNYRQTMAFAKRALECSQQVQNTYTEIASLNTLGDINMQLLNSATAMQLYRQAVQKGAMNPAFSKERLRALFCLTIASADTSNPAALATRLKPILDSLILENSDRTARYLGDLADIQWQAGQYEAALKTYTAGINNAKTFENTTYLTSTLLGKAECLSLLGRYKEAYPLLQAINLYLQKWENPEEYAKYLYVLGLCEVNLKKQTLGINRLNQAWAIKANIAKQKTDAVIQITKQLTTVENQTRLLQAENQALMLKNRGNRALALAVAAILVSILIIVYTQFKRKQIQRQTLLQYQKIVAQLTSLAPENYDTIPYRDANSVIKIAQEVVEKFKENSDQKTEQLRAFNYTISHDLKAPLANAEHFADLLELHLVKYKDQSALINLAHFRELIAEMKQMIDGISAYARADAVELIVAPTETTMLLNSVARQLAALYPHAPRCVQIGPLPSLNGDPLLLRQVFSNLLENALKSTQHIQQPMIQVSGQTTQQVVHIEIKDNGVGFAPSAEERIFELFRSAHEQHRFKGTGIGLAIVRRIVERHGGKVRAHSDGAGKGACFLLEFHVKDNKEPQNNL